MDCFFQNRKLFFPPAGCKIVFRSDQRKSGDDRASGVPDRHRHGRNVPAVSAEIERIAFFPDIPDRPQHKFRFPFLRQIRAAFAGELQNFTFAFPIPPTLPG